MFKALFASLGVGGAKIDLILEKHTITMGEEVKGKIVLKGGESDQEIEGLSVDFCLASSYEQDDLYRNVDETIATVHITSDPFTIYPDQVKEFPFSFTCPMYLPVSSVNTRYFFQTNLEIKYAVDAKDRDFVDVLPSGLQKNFLEAFRALGMVHQDEGYTGKHNNGYQIIEFRATDWMKGKLKDIDFVYQPATTQHSVNGFFELEKKASGLIGMLVDELDLNEKKGFFHFSSADLATAEKATETIRQFIIQNTEGLIGNS